MGFFADVNVSQQYSPTVTYPFAQYAPVKNISYAPAPAYNISYGYAPAIQIQSPYATGGVVSATQKATPSATATSEGESAPSLSGAQLSSRLGVENWLVWVIVGVVGLGALYFFTRKK